jgi:hypothetical protein
MKTRKELSDANEFICPVCGKIHPVKNAYIRAVLVSENSDVNFRGNHYVDRISTSYVNVRFCPKCKNVRLRNKILRHISYFTIMPVIIMALISLFNWTSCFSWKGYFLYMAVLFIFYVPAVKFFRECLSPSLNKSILKRALDGNAITK